MAPAPKYSFEEQQQRILAAAEECIESSSLLDFTMSAIAKGAGLSMGSVYKHVSSKEDVLLALAIRKANHEYERASLIMSLDLTLPEKLVAFSLTDQRKVRRYSFDDELGILINSRLIRQRGSANWLDRLNSAMLRTADPFDTAFHQAVEQGEIKGRADLIKEINITGWALTVGYQQTVQFWERNIDKVNIQPPSSDSVYIRGLVRMINSYDWKTPVTSQGLQKICDQLEAHNYR
ncbi:TetR/AcrR family transcriptional regulator [Endozoicomonadaceae bacterium StTr2]